MVENPDGVSKNSANSSSVVQQFFQFTSSSQNASRTGNTWGRMAVHPEGILNSAFKRSSPNVARSSGNKNDKSQASQGKEKSSWMDFVSPLNSSRALRNGQVAPADVQDDDDAMPLPNKNGTTGVITANRNSEDVPAPFTTTGPSTGGLEDNLWAEFCCNQKTTGADWKAPTLRKDQCLICLNSVWSSKLACIEFPCGHVGHFQCMQAEWWKGRDREGRIAPACPACKHPLSSLQTRAMYDRLISEGVVDQSALPQLQISASAVARMRAQDVTASLTRRSGMFSSSEDKKIPNKKCRAKSAVGSSPSNSSFHSAGSGAEMFVLEAPSF
jgi:uncharacterized protein YbaR (Trm112 family)